MDQIFGIGRYQNKTKPNKNWGFKMEVFSKRGPSKFKLFNLLSWTHKTSKVAKYIKKKLTKFGGSEMEIPPKRGRQISKLFNHTR